MATEDTGPKVAFPTFVDLGGDATILVGPRGCQVRIRVCKALLSFASPYFNALLNSGFKESGVTLKEADVVLKDDEPDAVVNLCKILHMRYTWPVPMGSTEILHLAIVADKYACVRAIQLAVQPLFPLVTKNWKLDSVATRDLIVASYLLDHAPLFTEYTQAMLISNSDALNKLALSEIGQHIPLTAWFELETRRSEIGREVFSAITGLLDRRCSTDSCQRMGDWCLKLTKAIHLSALDRVSTNASISEILVKAEAVKIPNVDSTLSSCKSAQSYHLPPLSDKDFKALLKACRGKCKGLCLDCVRADGTEGKCWVPHG